MTNSNLSYNIVGAGAHDSPLVCRNRLVTRGVVGAAPYNSIHSGQFQFIEQTKGYTTVLTAIKAKLQPAAWLSLFYNVYGAVYGCSIAFCNASATGSMASGVSFSTFLS